MPIIAPKIIFSTHFDPQSNGHAFSYRYFECFEMNVRLLEKTETAQYRCALDSYAYSRKHRSCVFHHDVQLDNIGDRVIFEIGRLNPLKKDHVGVQVHGYLNFLVELVDWPEEWVIDRADPIWEYGQDGASFHIQRYDTIGASTPLSCPIIKGWNESGRASYRVIPHVQKTAKNLFLAENIDMACAFQPYDPHEPKHERGYGKRVNDDNIYMFKPERKKNYAKY